MHAYTLQVGMTVHQGTALTATTHPPTPLLNPPLQGLWAGRDPSLHSGLLGAERPESHRRGQTGPQHAQIQKPGVSRLSLTVPWAAASTGLLDPGTES